MRRRAFIAAAGGLAGCSTPLPPEATPPYLLGQQPLYEDSPRRAAAQWFRSCRLGLHLEYGVFSQLRRGPAVQFDERIPPAQYERLRSTFDPGGFDAERLADLAAACGMDYIGLTARGADGFCLFRTVETDFNSLEASGRDLLGELCQACRSRRLGLVISFSYAADWRHPYFYPAETARTDWQGARPAYESAPAEYRFEKDEDFLLYIRHVHRQLREVVYRYRPLAAIRLEPGDGYHARPDLFPVAQTYSLLREAWSGLLVAFGLGASGDEDFAAAEGLQLPRPVTAMAAQAWDRNREKPLELALTLAGGGPAPAPCWTAIARLPRWGRDCWSACGCERTDLPARPPWKACGPSRSCALRRPGRGPRPRRAGRPRYPRRRRNTKAWRPPSGH